MDFTTPTTLYYKLTNMLQQTQDGGDTWPVIATVPVTIAKMAVAPSTSNTVVVSGMRPLCEQQRHRRHERLVHRRMPVSLAASVGGANGILIDPTNREVL